MSPLAHAINRPAALIVILTLIALFVTAQLTAAAPRSPDRLTSTSATASVVISPTVTGGFGSPGGTASFKLRINNANGAADTFDLIPNSLWPMTFYRLDGVTPLTDTDGDGAIDTGAVVANWYAFIVVKLAVPAGATVGQYSTGTLTVQSSAAPAQSSVATFTVAVPAPFAQSYAPNDQPQLSVNRLYLQTTQPTAASYGYNPAVATTPDGNLVQVWEQGRTNSQGKKIYELYWAVLDGQGNLIRPATALTNLDSAVDNTHDNHPALAVAPDGRLGVIWYRSRTDAVGNFNYNVFTLVLDSNGGVVLPPTTLTNNTQWGTTLTPYVPQFFEPTLAATPDNRFMLMWRQQLYNGFSTKNALWYTVRDSGGSVLKPVAQFGTDTCSYHPHLTALFDGSVFLVQETCAKVAYARLNSSGGLLVNPIVLTSYTGNDGPVAAQLANGNLLLAWQHNTGLRYALQYAVLNAALGIVKAPTDLPGISPVGEDDVSATRAADQAVLTWTDVYTDHPNLYYTLLDNSGGLITPPIIIATDLSQRLAVATNGQGNTYLVVDTTLPTNPMSLSSSDHTLNQWSNDNTIDVTWSGASDSNGIGGYSIGWDTNPIGLPDAQRDLPASAISTTSPALANGLWYFHIRTVDVDGNWTTMAAHLGPFKIDTTPPQSAAQSPLYAVGPFTITWSGSDVGSGLTGYNVFVRDQSIGPWTLWLNNTLTTRGVYTGTIGHTYYFRSEARDAAGNIETDLPADGDAHTTVAAFQVDGQVYNNRHAPIYNARVEAQPAALTTTHSDTRGGYALYFINSAVYTLTANRADYGLLPPRHNLILTRTQIGPDLVLPPLNDAVINGGWESGDLTGWSVDPAITATVEFTAAHTGRHGLHLASPLTGTDSLPVLTQTLTIPGAQSALSLMYRVTEGGVDPFIIALTSDSEVLTHELIMTPTTWNHTWVDLAPFASKAVTISLGFQNPGVAQQIDLDEISIGATQPGVYSVFMPVVRR